MIHDCWTQEHAWAWHNAHAWLCGVNYVTSTAVNTTEMWQRETFDADTIDRELGYAQDIGFNCYRVFVQYLVWEHDPAGLLQRFDQFLSIAHKRGIAIVPILFDDCAFSNKEPYIGKQDAPTPGIHNSCWTPSPGSKRVTDQSAWLQLQRYVHEFVSRYANDARVLMWDLYNEPGNSNMGNASLPLLQAAFEWARAANPTQPITTGIWHDGMVEINAYCVAASDVITFHDYNELSITHSRVEQLKTYGYPLVCTEWMRRGYGSHFDMQLPYFQKQNIGCLSWGLVNGRTQTHLPWESRPGDRAPAAWFQDLLDQHGNPHRPEEVALIRAILRK